MTVHRLIDRALLLRAKYAGRDAGKAVMAAGENVLAASLAYCAAFDAELAHATPETPVMISALTAELDRWLEIGGSILTDAVPPVVCQ